MNATIPKELAARIATAAAGIGGVRSAIVCSAEGAVLGTAGVAEPAKEAALCSFIAARAEALPVDGDLRGMGRQLAGSTFSHMAITGAQGDSMLYNLNGGAYLSVKIAAGRTPAASEPLASLVRKAVSLPESSMRSSRP